MVKNSRNVPGLVITLRRKVRDVMADRSGAVSGVLAALRAVSFMGTRTLSAWQVSAFMSQSMGQLSSQPKG